MGAKGSKPTLVRVVLPNGCFCCYEGPTPVWRVMSDFPGFEVSAPARLYRSQKDQLPKEKILQPGRIYFLRPAPFFPLQHFKIQAKREERDFANLQHLNLETGDQAGTKPKLFSPFMSSSRKLKENSNLRQVSPISSYLFRKQSPSSSNPSEPIDVSGAKSKTESEHRPKSKASHPFLKFSFLRDHGRGRAKPTNEPSAGSRASVFDSLDRMDQVKTQSAPEITPPIELIRIPMEDASPEALTKPCAAPSHEKNQEQDQGEKPIEELDVSNMSEFCKSILTMETNKLFRWRPCLPIIGESEELVVPVLQRMRHRRVNTAL